MYKPAKVIMLPTDKYRFEGGQLWINILGELKLSQPNKIAFTEQRHQELYFITDEMPQEGNWMYSSISNEILRYYSNETSLSQWAHKIVATTDPTFLGLPKIDISFLEEYVKQQGKIDEVLLAYDVSKSMNKDQFPDKLYLHPAGCVMWKLKDKINTTLTESDIKHLEWIYNRWTYNHPENIDYMLKFKEIINKLKTQIS